MKTKKLKIFLLIVCLGVLSIWVFKPIAEDAWSRFMDFTNPNYFSDLKNQWQKTPTDLLISKLNHPSSEFSGVATSILRERRGSEVQISKIEEIINQTKNLRGRELALSVLFVWNEKKAIDFSIGILESGRIHPMFNNALLHLSRRRYEPAYPYALELANAPDKYDNGSQAYIADFCKIESLPILEDMLKNAPDNFHKDLIMHAIQTVKEHAQ